MRSIVFLLNGVKLVRIIFYSKIRSKPHIRRGKRLLERERVQKKESAVQRHTSLSFWLRVWDNIWYTQTHVVCPAAYCVCAQSNDHITQKSYRINWPRFSFRVPSGTWPAPNLDCQTIYNDLACSQSLKVIKRDGQNFEVNWNEIFGSRPVICWAQNQVMTKVSVKVIYRCIKLHIFVRREIISALFVSETNYERVSHIAAKSLRMFAQQTHSRGGSVAAYLHFDPDSIWRLPSWVKITAEKTGWLLVVEAGTGWYFSNNTPYNSNRC